MLMNSDVSGHIRKDHAAWARVWLEQNGYTGWEVVVSREDQLMIDYDQVSCYWDLPTQFYTTMCILAQSFVPEGEAPVLLPYERFASKGGNTHVIITLPYALSDSQRVAWQAAFGSDPKREALHMLSIARKELNPILLYMKRKQLALPEVAPQKLLTE